MKIVKVLLASVIVYLSFPVLAQDQDLETELEGAVENTKSATPDQKQAEKSKKPSQVKQSTGYVSDELFVFTHAGAGNNYRIMGRLAAGSKIKLTGNRDNDFAQLIDERKRAVWVETKYLSKSPGLRATVEKLNNRNANLMEKNEQLVAELDQSEKMISAAKVEQEKLSTNLIELNQQLIATKAKLRDEDTNIKTQWFYNGSIVMGVGLLLGLILPRLGSRKKSNVNDWK